MFNKSTWKFMQHKCAATPVSVLRYTHESYTHFRQGIFINKPRIEHLGNVLAHRHARLQLPRIKTSAAQTKVPIIDLYCRNVMTVRFKIEHFMITQGKRLRNCTGRSPLETFQVPKAQMFRVNTLVTRGNFDELASP